MGSNRVRLRMKRGTRNGTNGSSPDRVKKMKQNQLPYIIVPALLGIEPNIDNITNSAN